MDTVNTVDTWNTNPGASAVASILVIEDEKDISRVIQLNLTPEGFSVSCADDGLSGLEQARQIKPDLILLDLMLPGMNGLEVCRKLKSDDATRHIPVIMVTAKGEESDIVLGLGIGAEDYITKPFKISVLIARVRAAFRRREEISEAGKKYKAFELQGLRLDDVQHSLEIDGTGVEITATEFRLLSNLVRSRGRVYSRQLLVDIAIGDDVYVNERTIDSHVSSLRRKLGPYRGWIKTVWGVGYRFEPSELKTGKDQDG